MRALVVALLALTACESSVRPATPGPRATATAQEFRRHDQETRWVVTVNNPTTEDVILDCDELRLRVAAHTQTDILLTPEDQGCDLKNAVEYINDTGERPARERRHSWCRWSPKFRTGP